MKPNFPIALSIAGFDGSGGAGMQADMKVFSARGVYACTVLTSLPVQNTQGVRAVYDLPLESIGEQIDSQFEDLDIRAVKIGMLHKVDIIQVIAERIQKYKPEFVVVDPVMVAKSGHRLLVPEAVDALKEYILPLATVLTPNLPEATDLLGREIGKESEMADAGRELLKFGSRSVLVKGGHLEGSSQSSDCLVQEASVSWFRSDRIQTKNTHGTGCTYSAAIAAELAKGKSIPEAVRLAKDYLTGAMRAGADLEIGKGKGPVHHFYSVW
jgi:hydroxymethylpyrimidine/phosphomethylpyrimidine kinase